MIGAPKITIRWLFLVSLLLITAVFHSVTAFGATWYEVGFYIDGEAVSDGFGNSISFNSDGTVVAIGAPGNDGTGDRAGHVQVYEKKETIKGTRWIQIGDDIDGEAALDYSGSSVSLNSDGTILAIGAPGNADNGIESGHVRVYRNISSNWTQVGDDIDGEAAYHRSGSSVSLNSDGTMLAIGAPEKGHAPDSNPGQVRVYRKIETITDTIWTQIGDDINGDGYNDGFGLTGDKFGSSVSLNSDGTILAVRAPVVSQTRVYEKIETITGPIWTQIGNDINAEAIEGQPGVNTVSLNSDGTMVAIGTPSSNHVRVYRNISGSWIQIGADIDGEAGMGAGYSVSLSGNGNIVAIGVANSYMGLPRVYEKIETITGPIWTQIGGDIGGEDLTDCVRELPVSLSSDGTVVAIGNFPDYCVAYNNPGEVRIFSQIETFLIERFLWSKFLPAIIHPR